MKAEWMRFANRPRARARIFCFPHAGGGAATYRTWASAFPEEWEVIAVQLPGRGQLLRSSLVINMGEMVEGLLPSLIPQLDVPFALFGHSMGAVLAAEIARTLHAEWGKRPEYLAVSGRRPPRLVIDDAPLHTLPEPEFISEVNRRYGGIPPELLRDREVLNLLLPSLRADLTALETHVPVPSVPLTCPITAYGGADDPVAPLAHLEAWRGETTGAFRVRQFPGGHFYLTARMSELIADITRELASIGSLHRVEDAHA